VIVDDGSCEETGFDQACLPGADKAFGEGFAKHDVPSQWYMHLFGIGAFVRTRGFTRTWFHAGNKRKYRCSSLAYWMQLHCGSRSVSCQLASKNWWSLTRNANERQRELMNSNRTLRFFSIFNGIILLFTNNNTASYLSFSIIPSFVNYNWQQKLH
jgi:hypothetical protein